ALNIQADDIYRCLVENSADGLIVTDADGVIVACNAAFAHLIEKSESDILGQPVKSFIESNETSECCGSSKDDANGTGTTDDTTSVRHYGYFGKLAEKNIPVPKPATIIVRSGMDLQMPVVSVPILGKNKEPAGHLTIVYIVQAHSVQQAQTEFVSTVS